VNVDLSRMKPLTIVGLGELLWDLLPEGKQVGGAPANFAYHAGALSGAGVVVSAVGDDASGRELRERLAGKGLDVTHVAADPTHPTGTVSVAVDEAGNPEYTIHEDVAWDFIPNEDGLKTLAGRCDAVCFGTLAQRAPQSRATIQSFVGATNAKCLRVYDINLRQSFYSTGVIEESLRLATILKINDEELPVVAGLLAIDGTDYEIMRTLIANYGLDMVALTRGKRGSVIQTADTVTEDEGQVPTSLADTVGAGDSFTAALVVGLLQGRDLNTVSAEANRLASFVCSQKGAMPPIPDSFRTE